ncbi:MAG: radical SAM/Cys-rich domain protein [Desulfobulbus sp.]|nr:MAG: radical SAM/Cys-rich domain protein [Desulfobulbus sp.]
MNRFQQTLTAHGLRLTRGKAATLQVNVGRLCNLACRHCHLEAGPGRDEVMSRATMDEVVSLARRLSFNVIDVTGGAPELIPGIESFLARLAPLAPRLMLRTNLILLAEGNEELLAICRRHRVVLVASLPSTNKGQTEAQRGSGILTQSIGVLQKLNNLGYGKADSGLELYLVSNPSGAFLPVDQCAAERKFRADLARKWGIEITGLFTFANVPLGRFKSWLKDSGNYEAYMAKLVHSFNPATLQGLMCRTLISVSWDGLLYDCDFNLAAGLPYSGEPVHVSTVTELPEGVAVMTDEYCFACTAGSGFT